ncbi:MAG: acetate/propionate family kinase [Alphaproteobacteria bacterium]|nr:acetate/propionate family kinase [Alphaproteobacteria bacterium]
MTDTILTLNAGSSSVKFQLFARDPALSRLADGHVTNIGGNPTFHAVNDAYLHDNVTTTLPKGATHEQALRAIIDWVHAHNAGWKITIAAHRVVHGGTLFTAPTRVDSHIFHQLKALCPLAPLHQPHNLKALGIVDGLLPHVPQIACFDTAFHARHDPLFTQFALPAEIRDKGVRRYGFHGLSYEWIAHYLHRNYPDLAQRRVVVAHLGNGASLCALQHGQSIDTTMGMTALDGLPMGTRCGALDAGAVIYMLRDLGMQADDVEQMLYAQSGLLGLSDISNDVKVLHENGSKDALFALDYFAMKVAQYTAMMAVSMNGIDGLVFTGGIGENAGSVRDAVVARLAFLKIPAVLIVPANEERMMAMQAVTCLSS